MMHPHNKENQVVTAQTYIISCNLHTPISCKFLLKFTHKLLAANCGRNLISQSHIQSYSKYRIFTLKKSGKGAIAQAP